MKTNNDMLHGGKLKPEFYQSWANYYVKFIKAYETAGIPVWGLTLQNEPMASQTWESCIYTAQDEANYVKKYLGPTLQKNNLGSKKLMVWDHNRDLVYQQASTILNDKEAAKYIWGIGFHWYENWVGGENTFDNVRRVKEAFPEKNVMLTEACNFPFSWQHIDDWNWGEIYGKNMIHDFNNGAVGWTDWNILLNEKGGPNHVENNCFAPVHTTADGKLHYMNSFYYIGHFSKFIRPGAKRIITSSSRSLLLTTGFKNTDGKVVVVVMNPSDNKLDFHLWINGNAAPAIALPHSIATYVIE
jgi:glucosylceramidase